MKKDISGNIYGRLTVIGLHSTGKNSKWECQCECGNKAIVSTPNLSSGNTKSCGCLNKELASNRNSTHGHSKGYKPTRVYNIWMLMVKRCTKSSDKRFSSYGGRGITVCPEWLSFENFLKDMGEPPPNMMLERRDNDRGYSKDNCTWADKITQARNKRSTHWITYSGIRKSLAAWSELTGIPPDTISSRINKHGWPVGKALEFD